MMKTKKLENLNSLSLKDFGILNILYLSNSEHNGKMSIPMIIERARLQYSTLENLTQSYVRAFLLDLLQRDYVIEHRGLSSHDVSYSFTDSGIEFYIKIHNTMKDLVRNSELGVDLKLSAITVINNLKKLDFENKIILFRAIAISLKDDDDIDVVWNINNIKK